MISERMLEVLAVDLGLIIIAGWFYILLLMFREFQTVSSAVNRLTNSHLMQDLNLGNKDPLADNELNLNETDSRKLDEGRIKKAIKLGAEFVLAKPFDDESLHKAIIPLIKVKAENGFVLPKLNRLQQVLDRSLPVEVKLTSSVQQQVSSELLPCIVGLFEDKATSKIRSIAVLNLQAACILGGIKSELAKGEIDKMLAEKSISKGALEGGKKALSDCAAAFIIPGSKRNLAFKNMIVLADDLQKVEALFNKPAEQRLDLSCQSAGLQSGSITIIAS